MRYLSGAIQPSVLASPDLGALLTPNMGNRPDLSRTAWAADTGCFSTRTPFRLDAYLAWLVELLPHRHTCLFATAPDVVPMNIADEDQAAALTWARARHTLPVIRALGLPAALVAQNGLERMAVPWDAFDVLFVGGTTAWKLSPQAAALVYEAKRREKHVHMGRVNSARRLRYASEIGCDSVDGTFLKFGPDVNLPRLRRWMTGLERQPSLWAS